MANTKLDVLAAQVASLSALIGRQVGVAPQAQAALIAQAAQPQSWDTPAPAPAGPAGVVAIVGKLARPGVLAVEIDGQRVTANAHDFTSGSCGYFATGKVDVTSVRDGRVCKHQVTINITEVGSKPKA